MNHLQPTINLYYDRIVDEMPVPNGVVSYEFSRDKYRIPICRNKKSQVYITTILYNVLKALGVSNQTFSGNENAKNLYYPLELLETDIIDISQIIPIKSLNKIRKGKMKLLVFVPYWTLNRNSLYFLSAKLKNLLAMNIAKSQIKIVLGDTKRAFSNFFEGIEIFGIDWWHIVAQITYKSRYRMQDWFWVFRNTSAIGRSEEFIEKENFKIEDWNPKRLFTALTGVSNLHNLILLKNMHTRNLINEGLYSYNLDGNIESVKQLYLNSLSEDFNQDLKYKSQEALNLLGNGTIQIDVSYQKLKEDPLFIDGKLFNQSLMMIVSQNYLPNYGDLYKDELTMCSPSLSIYRQIAKGHPFMFMGHLNTIIHLGNEGYFTETIQNYQFYDRVSDLERKTNSFCDSLENIKNQFYDDPKKYMETVIPYMQKNKKTFFNKKNERKLEKLFRELAYE